MKKILAILLMVSLSVMLTSCEVHFFGQSYDIHWLIITIPVAAVLLLAFLFVGLRVSKKKYVCPHCNGAFYPNFWKSAFAIHMNSDRIFKCPHCGKRGFCKLWGEDV